MRIYDAVCENLKNPLGLDTEHPSFSWKIDGDSPGLTQTHYRLRVARDDGFARPLWDTGKRESDVSIHHIYDGEPLAPLSEYIWRVTVWTTDGTAEASGTFETGFMDKAPWQASWLTADKIETVLFRREFTVGKPVAKARLYASALGLYEARFNGATADDTLLNPGWTSYDHCVQYQAIDVLPHIHSGENRWELLLNRGWYSGSFAFDRRENIYGDTNAVIAELHLTYEDGSRDILVTDGQFRWTADGPIRKAHIYDGFEYDSRREDDTDWTWQRAAVFPHPKDKLTASAGVPVRRILEIDPVAMLTTPSGETVIDMGQNMVGFLRVTVHSNAGEAVTLRHAEILDADSNFYTDNLRSARQEVTYITKGGKQTFEPKFTFQGFRYVKVIDYPGAPRLEDFTGVVICGDMRITGEFSCSNALINRLCENIRWGQLGNFVDVPTDCPQRDERMGWTADAQIFMKTAGYQMDVSRFFKKWMRDLRFDQYPNGAVPFVVPDILPKDWGPTKDWEGDHASASWGDAATIVPWVHYQHYGDPRILEENFACMCAWVDYMARESGESCIWRTGPQLGDWVALDAFEGSYYGATPTELIATAHFAYSTKLLEKACAVLGKKQEQDRYGMLYSKIVDAFRREFLNDGQITSDTQTSYIVPLAFDLLGDARGDAVEALVRHLARHNNHLTTGFVGTPYLCHALSENGRADIAFELLFQEDFPSWLYQVKKGATTVWEHWDGIREDGSFWSPNMNSFNHYAYGSVGDWLFGVVAGINTDENAPGYKKIIFKPHITDKLDYVTCHFESVHGRIESNWRREQGAVRYSFLVPANTTASAYLPMCEVRTLVPGRHEFVVPLS